MNNTINTVVNNTIAISATKGHSAFDHVSTLIGQHTTGSSWNASYMPEDTDKLKDLMNKAELFVGSGKAFAPFCTYYHGKERTEVGKIGIITGKDLSSKSKVIVGTGDHGLELHIKRERMVTVCTTVRTKEYWVIVGPAGKDENGEEDNTPIIWTSYPGPITARIPEDFFKGKYPGMEVGLSEIEDDWAVKLT
jgi:hypothetical protein